VAIGHQHSHCRSDLYHLHFKSSLDHLTSGRTTANLFPSPANFSFFFPAKGSYFFLPQPTSVANSSINATILLSLYRLLLILPS
jgi:hypothetical protein